MQRGLDRVFGAAIGVAGRRDLKFIARQEMHGETTDVLAGVVGNRHCFGVSAFLGNYFYCPSVILGFVNKTRETIGISHTSLLSNNL